MKVGFLSGRFIEPVPTKSERVPSGFLSVIQEEDESFNTDEGGFLIRNDHSNTDPLLLGNNIEEEVLREKLRKKFGRKVTAVRSTFLLSGIGVIIAGSVYYGKAVKSFNNSFDEVRVETSVSTDMLLFYDLIGSDASFSVIFCLQIFIYLRTFETRF
jgi:hypothetical protein